MIGWKWRRASLIHKVMRMLRIIMLMPRKKCLRIYNSFACGLLFAAFACLRRSGYAQAGIEFADSHYIKVELPNLWLEEKF